MAELPKGFISMEACIKLLKKHTSKDPVLDLGFMAVNRDYIEHGHNFTIHLKRKNKDGKVVDAGTVWVEVKDDRDKFNLRGEIKDAVKRVYDMDINFDYSDVNNVSTVIDPNTNSQGRPVLNDPLAPSLKYNLQQGDNI